MGKISLTVDAVIFGYDKTLKVLLVQRKNPPFQGQWAIPGGFVEENETLHTAACRELKEETSIHGVPLVPVTFCDDPTRDPRGHTVSMVFWGFTSDMAHAKAGSDAKKLAWWPIAKLPPLAFDHYQVLQEVHAYLQRLHEISRPLLESGQNLSVAEFSIMLEKLCRGQMKIQKTRT